MSLSEYRAAGDRWIAEITKEFGEGQEHLQFSIEGQGQPGTPLRKAYLEARLAHCTYELDMLNNKPFHVSVEHERVALRKRIADLGNRLENESARAS